MKKFTGGMGDDDDRKEGGDDSVWKRYFTKVLTSYNALLLSCTVVFYLLGTYQITTEQSRIIAEIVGNLAINCCLL